MAKQIGLGVVVDFSSAQQGFGTLEKSLSKSRESAQKLGSVLGSFSADMGTAGKAVGALSTVLMAATPQLAAFAAISAGITLLADSFRSIQREAEAATKATNDFLEKVKQTRAQTVDAARDARVQAAILREETEEGKSRVRAADEERKAKEQLKKAEKDLADFLSGKSNAPVAEGQWDKVRTNLQANVIAAKAALRDIQELGDAQIEDGVRKDKVATDRKSAEELRKTTELNKQKQQAWDQYLAKSTADDAAAGVEQFNRAAANARAIKNEREALHQEELRDRFIAEANAEKERTALRSKGALTPEHSARIDADLTKALDRIGQTYEAKLAEYLKRLGQALRDAQTDTSGYEEDGARMDDYWKLKAQDFQDAQAKMRAELQQTAASAQQWGSTLGNIFGQLATKQMTLGQAMASIGQMIIQSVTQAAIASITADASRAAAGAAASQAGIPIVGPVLAISAMGAMLAAVMGLIGNVGSAAGGAVLPGSGGPFPFVLHPNETVLPADLSLGMQELIADGGPGGGTTVVIQALDTKSFYQALKRNDPELIKVINEARADRRL